ncbi:MAG: PEP-CTERM sorting domain-containing protein [Acidobacteriota bacterium]|nr:PEP-CTERM sorting domain-containing protein [Acidobacteriota bacterium]
MKLTHTVTLPARLLAALLGAASLGAAASAHAQANLSFSGGNNTPLVLTLNAPVTYLINITGAAGNAPFFDFQGVGNLFNQSFPAITSTVTFSINAGAPFTITNENSGVAFGAFAANDVYLYSNALPGVAASSVITLSAGTVTTTGNYAPAPPGGGSFNTFVVDGNGTRLSPNGVAVPEPATWALLGLGSPVLLGAMRRREAKPPKT